MLVDKYLNSIKDDRKEHITYIDLEDVGSTPSEENVELARKYGVTATPVLIAVDDEVSLKPILVACRSLKIFEKFTTNMLNSNVVAKQVPNVSGTTSQKISRMNVRSSGIGGKNYLIKIQAVKKQKMLGKNGVTVLQNLAKW